MNLLRILGARLCLLVVVIALGSCSDEHRRTTERAGMRAEMSDEQLLRIMKRDPSRMVREVTHGDDGSSTSYNDAEEEIVVTRSVVTGVVVLRHIKRSNVWQTWVLGK